MSGSLVGPQGSPPGQNPSDPVKKRAHRITRACDLCHERSIRCRPSDEATGSSVCHACFQSGRECTYDRPAKKRGVQAAVPGASSVPRTLSRAVPREQDQLALRLPDLLTPEAISIFVDVYFEFLYPCFPIFHRPSLLERISNRDYDTDRPFFGVLMAICGLSSSRMHHPAFPARSRLPAHLEGAAQPAVFAQLAGAAIPKEPRASDSLDHLRSCVLLANLALHHNDVRQFKYFLGLYNTLWSLENYHRERNWPPGTPDLEIEERRRLFWSAYKLEVLSAACFNSSALSREAHIDIPYPDLFADEGRLAENAATQDPPHWLVGFRFLIDVFRALENALDQRKARMQDPSRAVRHYFVADVPPTSTVFSTVAQCYAELPPAFTQIKSLMPSPEQNRYTIVATNIAATIQLLHIVLYCADEDTAQVCLNIGKQVHQTFCTAPSDVVFAIGAQVLQQIATIAEIMAQKSAPVLFDETFATMHALHALLRQFEMRDAGSEQASERLRGWLENASRAT